MSREKTIQNRIYFVKSELQANESRRHSLSMDIESATEQIIDLDWMRELLEFALVKLQSEEQQQREAEAVNSIKARVEAQLEEEKNAEVFTTIVKDMAAKGLARYCNPNMTFEELREACASARLAQDDKTWPEIILTENAYRSVMSDMRRVQAEQVEKDIEQSVANLQGCAGFSSRDDLFKMKLLAESLHYENENIETMIRFSKENNSHPVIYGVKVRIV